MWSSVSRVGGLGLHSSWQNLSMITGFLYNCRPWKDHTMNPVSICKTHRVVYLFTEKLYVHSNNDGTQFIQCTITKNTSAIIIIQTTHKHGKPQIVYHTHSHTHLTTQLCLAFTLLIYLNPFVGLYKEHNA